MADQAGGTYWVLISKMYLVNLSLPHYSRASPTQRVYFSVSQLAPVKLIDRCVKGQVIVGEW